jgi:hypothetical protein
VRKAIEFVAKGLSKPVDSSKAPPDVSPEEEQKALLESITKMVAQLPSVEGAAAADVRAHVLADAMISAMEAVSEEEQGLGGSSKEECARAKAALIIRDAFISVACAFGSVAGVDVSPVSR